jgi:hypothetical protein
LRYTSEEGVQGTRGKDDPAFAGAAYAVAKAMVHKTADKNLKGREMGSVRRETWDAGIWRGF